MRQAPFHDLQGSRQQHGARRAVVGAEAGTAARRAHLTAAQQRLAADADRHGIEVTGKQPPRAAPCSLQLENQVAGVAAERRTALHAVADDDLGRYARRAQLAADIARYLRLFAALAGNGHQFHGQVARPGQIRFPIAHAVRSVIAGAGKRGSVLVGGILLLAALDRKDLRPGGQQATRARRQVVADKPVQFSEAVAGHCRIHMVLNVVVHMPIQKSQQRVEDDGTGR